MPGLSVARLEIPPSPVTATAIGRRETYLWAAICLLANQAMQLLDASSLDALAASIAEQNYVYWLTCYAIIYRLWASDRRTPASRLDLWLLAAACAAILATSFVPYRFTAGVLATFTAGYFLNSAGRIDRNVNSAGCVLLALATQLVWAPILFQFFTPELLPVDAALVGGVLKWLRPDIIRDGNTFFAAGGHAIALVGGCSSFNNLSTAILACVTVIMLNRTEWVWRDLAIVAITSAAMIAMNVLRICLLCWSSELYSFWHDGAGAATFNIAQTFAVLLIAWLGATRGTRPA